MDLKEAFPVEAEMVKDGIDVPVGGATFTLSFSNSSKVQLMLQAEAQKLMATGMDPEDAAVLALRYVLVNNLVLGWKDLKEDGVEVPYSKDECARIMEQYVGLDSIIMNEASKVENFKQEKKEEHQGN